MLASRLNALAHNNISFEQSRNIFSEAFINDWSSKSLELISQYLEVTDVDEKHDWLRNFFIELFQILYLPNLPNNVTIQLLAQLINELVQKSNDSSELIGMAFVSASSTYSKEDDNRLLLLAKEIPVLYDELFKFSPISSKLMTKDQMVLMRHLLKKTKFELKKYNLLFECSSGYGNLIALLYMAFHDIDKIDKIDFYSHELSHVMGKFSLDSMRSLDLILRISSEFVTEDYNFILKLLQATDFWPNEKLSNSNISNSDHLSENVIVSNVIAFTINSFAMDDPTKLDSIRYIDMCCILIKSKFVHFSHIWIKLSPTSKEFVKQLQEYQDKLEKESMQGVSNPLAMAAALSLEDDEDEEANGRKVDDNKLTQKSPNSSEGKKTSDDHESKAQNTTNNNNIDITGSVHILFLERLLSIGCYDAVVQIFREHPSLMSVNKLIPKLFARLFEYRINSLYENTCLSQIENLTGALKDTVNESDLISHRSKLINYELTHDPYETTFLNTKFKFFYEDWKSELAIIESIEKLFEESHSFFYTIGPYLSHATILLSKLVRLGISDIKDEKDDELRVSKIDKWIDYTRKFIMPTLPLLENCPSVATNIYELLSMFSFEKRYFLYNEVLSKLSKDDVNVKIGFNRAAREAKRLLKVLNTDNIEQEARNFSCVLSTNPLATLTNVVEQVENYDKVTELVIITAKYFNNFAYDVLQYIILQRISQQRNTVQDDGVNPTSWVTRISSFIAGLTKKCPNMNIDKIITFIIKTLHKGNIIAISILKELLHTVGGIRDLNEVNIKQLKMLNSAPQLQSIARSLIYDTRDQNSEQSQKLIKIFKEQNSLSEVIILLNNLILEANSLPLHYKILSSNCDELNSLLWSFIELVQYTMSKDEFRETIIPFRLLSNNHRISVPWLFHLWRSNIGSNKESNANIFLNMKDDVTFTDVDTSLIDYELFIYFWTFDLYNMHHDSALYKEAELILEKELKSETNSRKISHLKKQINELSNSSGVHQRDFNETTETLKNKSNTWENSLDEKGIEMFLQYCIIPRSLFNPLDSLYSSYFLLQNFEVEKLLEIASTLFNSDILGTLLFSCTSLEAGNLGIFFNSFLSKIEEIREKNGIDHPKAKDIYSWYYNFLKQIISTLLNNNYMSIRNGIEFMKYVTNIFPIVDDHIHLLIKTLERRLSDEKREDIKLPSTALLGHLKARLKKAKTKFDFYVLTGSEKESHDTYIQEVKEIEIAKSAEDNVKKQDTLRKRIEASKPSAVKSEISIHKEPSSVLSTPSPVNNNVFQVVRLIKEISYHISADNFNRVLSLLDDNVMSQKIKDLSKRTNSVNYYKSQLLNLLEDHFRNLSRGASDEQLELQLKDLKLLISKLDHILGRTSTPLYSENSSAHTSRYNRDSTNDQNIDSKRDFRTASNYRHNIGKSTIQVDQNKAHGDNRVPKRKLRIVNLYIQ
ncbi:hypothetical protein TPHA_0I01340 [Tetrapisispora phaffii CBS 4417]|uniref:THO complex subunit 2 n=1 Tax=Tetrapisispora phaffii (strain ATCC 24235 / CBS 4417 / NBRC 1672 / NRRL Y-8282 / UCD 70-5) TaxID=1071381 RepID=G8BXL3_TETPH|nr:hypothetical protein TPHA_0I01340 [Tetrapisispora phaffii CBS 4417]CCE64641.1 hypothetical protein TPHA_0I01340 [Tetrapisispora phaffii CBS 4417]